MASVFQSIIDSFKTAIADLEKIVKESIDTIKQFSEDAASKISLVSRDIINGIRTKISSFIAIFTNRIKSLTTTSAPTAGSSTSSFGSKIESAARDAGKGLEELMEGFKKIMVDLVDKSATAVKEVADGFDDVAKDATDIAEIAVKDTTEALVKIGDDSVEVLAKVSEDIVEDIEVDVSFVAKHGITITEVAVISIVPIPVVISLGLSAALVICAANYTP